MPRWSFLLADQFGNGLAELSTGAGRSLTFMRNAAPSVSISLSHDDDAAVALFAALRTGIPTLRAYRDGVLRFHGHLAPFAEELEEETHLNLMFLGPFARLTGYGQSRGRFTSTLRRFTATDAGQIAKTLIDETPAAGISTAGSIAVTSSRDRTYGYANVGAAIINLTRVLDGFDFEITPMEYSAGNIGQLNIYASQGSDRASTVRFQYGPGTLANVRAVTRQTEPPINTARVLGANGIVALKTDASSIAAYGEWWVQESASDTSQQSVLDSKAQALLRPNWIKVTTFSPDPTLAPAPWDDYWLGDTVSFYGRRGAFVEDVTARINKISLVVDDEGNEAYEVEQPGTEETLTGEVEVEVVT